MRGPAILGAAVVSGGLALLLDGTEPFGRMALRTGLPALSLPLTNDPELRGEALYRAGRFEEAAAAFERAGVTALYNLGNAHARTGRYAEALLAYDGVVMREPDHADARANFALVATLYGGTRLELNSGMMLPMREREGPTAASFEAEGGARATGQGAEADQASTGFAKPELQTGFEQRRVSQRFEDLFIAASERWLATMEDQPGRYLAARLRSERQRRIEQGVAGPEGGDPW